MRKKQSQKAVMINTKLNNVLQKENANDLFGASFSVNNAPKRSNKVNEQKMMCTVQLEQDDIQLSREIDAYDRAIQDAVCSILENGNRYFTSEQLARAFVGTDNSVRGISKKRMDKIHETIEKLANIRAVIIYTNKKGRKFEVKNYLLPIKSFRKMTSDTYIYKLLDEPAIYSYAKSKRQLITIPAEIMNVQLSIKDTDDIVLIKRYLLRRIEMMKNKNNHISNYCISYDSILNELGVNDRVANVAKKKVYVRRAVNELLQFYVDKGYIDGFEEYRKDKSKQINGIKIIIKESEEQ